ncbi:MAG: hypothetical protein ACXAB7_15080 [Candidatus Kariarchaeaceae archaeon]
MAYPLVLAANRVFMANSQHKTTIPSEYQITGWITLFGALVALVLLVMGILIVDEIAQLNEPDDPEDIQTVITKNTTQVQLWLMLHSFLVLGYVSFYLGLYLLTRDLYPLLSVLAFTMALLAAASDLMANALLFSLTKGLPRGWDPHDMLYVILWVSTSVHLFSMYFAAMIYGVLFCGSFSRLSLKFRVGVLLLLTGISGISTLVFAGMQVISFICFILAMVYAAYVLLQEPEISLEDLILFEGDAQNFA